MLALLFCNTKIYTIQRIGGTAGVSEIYKIPLTLINLVLWAKRMLYNDVGNEVLRLPHENLRSTVTSPGVRVRAS